MKQLHKPIPPGTELAPTLSQRIIQLREIRNMTAYDVASSSRFPLKRIEDIESGMETWLSAADRQLLAKALNVEPGILQEVEIRRHYGESEVKESHMLDEATASTLTDSILNGGRDLKCPDCGKELKCSVQAATDMDGYPIKFAKAFCVKCPFVLRF